MNLPQGFTLENSVKPPPGFELTAEGSDGLPPDVKLPSGFSMVNDSTIPGAGLAHTVRAMAETGAGLATGFIAFPVSQLRGLWEYAITLGDKKAAAAAEEAWAKALQFEPTTEEAQGVMQMVSIAIGPIFNTLKQMGESSGGYPGGVAGQLGGAYVLGKAGKAVKGEIGTFGKRPIEAKPVEIPVEKIVPEVIPPKGFTLIESTPAVRPQDIKPPEGFKLEEPVKTVETLIVEPPPSPLPEVGAKGTESRLAIRAEVDAIEAKLTSDFGDLVEYKTMNMADQANRAAEIMDADYGKAKRMAMGEELPPQGIREATMYEAVKIRAIKEGDVDTLQKLATESTVPTRLSEYGQAIKAADSRIMEDPVKVMQDVAKTRAEKAQKTTGAKAVSPDAVAKLSQRVADLEKALAERQVSKTIERIKNEVAKEQRQVKRTIAKEELSAEFDGLVKELNSVLGGQLNVGVDPMAAVILGKMAKNRVQSGIITVEALVDSIYTAVKNMGIELSKRDIMDAISGYGKYKQLSKDEIMVQLRDLKGQMQQISKLEDLQNRQPPLKTGVERRIPSDEERRLIKLVEEAKRKYGIQTVDPATQLKSSMDAIKTRLKNQIADITNEIETGIRTAKSKGVSYDAEATALKKQSDFLATVRDALIESPAEMVIEKPGTLPVKKQREILPEQRVKMAIRAAERAQGAYAREVLGQIKKKTVSALETPELIEARNRANEWKERVKELRQVAGRSPEQSLKSLKTRLTNEARKLSDKLDNLDFSVKEKRAIELDPEAIKLKAARDQAKENYNAAVQASGTVTHEEAARIVELSKDMADKRAAYDPQTKTWPTKKAGKEYGAAKVSWERYIEELKGANAAVMEQVGGRLAEAKTKWKEDKVKASFDLAKDSAKTIADNSVVMAGSYDFSFIGRQGWFTLLTHPTAWVAGARNMFLGFAKELGSRGAMDAYLADVYSRPRYMEGEYQKAKLTSLKEEVYPADLLERMPIAGKGISVSKAAFLIAGMEMRLRTYDILAKMQERHGIDMMKGKEAESIGTVINSLTYRGKWGKTGVSPWVKLFWWAPNILKGQWDILTAHTLGYGLDTTFAKKQAFINLAKIVSEGVAIATIANSLNPGSAEIDPTGSEFGTIKIGKGKGSQNFDYTAGSRSLIITVARVVTGKSKNSKTGKVTDLDKGDFGKATRLTMPANLLLNKLNPPTGVVRDWLKGEFFGGEKFTWLGGFYRMYTPITIQQGIQLGEGKQPITGPRIGGVVSDIFGVNAPSFDKWKKR